MQSADSPARNLPAGVVHRDDDTAVSFCCSPPWLSWSTAAVLMLIVLPLSALIWWLTGDAVRTAIAHRDWPQFGTFGVILLAGVYMVWSTVFERVSVTVSAAGLSRQVWPCGLFCSGNLHIPLKDVAEIRWHAYEDVNEPRAGQGAQIEVRQRDHQDWLPLFDNPFLGTSFSNKILSPDHEELGRLLADEIRRACDRFGKTTPESSSQPGCPDR